MARRASGTPADQDSVGFTHHADAVSVERNFDAVPDRLGEAQVGRRVRPAATEQQVLLAVALGAIGCPDPDVADGVVQVEGILGKRADRGSTLPVIGRATSGAVGAILADALSPPVIARL